MNYLVIGLARSGVASCNLLVRKGQTVFAFDNNRKLCSELVESGILKQPIHMVKKINKKLLQQIDVMVISPGVSPERFDMLAKRYKIDIIGEMELAFQNCPCPVLAITGTNGKTTTTMLLGEIMKKSGADVRVVGNVGSAFSESVADMKKQSLALCEVSSAQLEKIQNFKPQIVGFLNIAPDHLDRYKRFENYVFAKSKIFKNMSKKDLAVLNYDDLLVRNFANQIHSQVRFFSLSELPKGVKGAYLKEGEIIFVESGKKTEKISVKQVKLKGIHNISNILCAVLMAKKFGVKAEHIQQAINEFKGLPHRLEAVGNIGGLEFYNDSKGTNIHSTLTALKSFSKPITLLLGGSSKGENFARLFENMPANVIKIITFGKSGSRIFSHGINSGFCNIVRREKLEDAFDEAVKKASGEEVVLLSPACASFDQFENFEERGDFFKYLVKGLCE